MKNCIVATLIAALLMVCTFAPVCAKKIDEWERNITISNSSSSFVAAGNTLQTRGTYGNLTYEIYGGVVVITGYLSAPSGALYIPSSIDGCPVVEIGNRAFANTSITSVSMPSVTIIDANAFEFCFMLSDASMSSVQHINYCAFNSCSMLSNVSMPNVIEIGDLAFYECVKLQSINIPNVQTIGIRAFYDCQSLQSASMQNVCTIFDDAFYNCIYLSTVKAENVKNIGNSAFIYCSSVVSVSFKGVVSIGANAFYGCSSLQEARFYCSAPSVGNDAFGNCSPYFIIYYPKGYTGWNTPYWNGYKTQMYNPSTGQPAYLVVFIDGISGAVICSIEADIHASVAAPNPPQHDGFVFVGWDKDFSNVIENLNVTALYESMQEPTPTATPTATPTSEPEVTIGDLNGDGKINTADAVIILRIAAGMIAQDENNTIAGDCNHDGKVNTGDAVLILRYTVGLITEF